MEKLNDVIIYRDFEGMTGIEMYEGGFMDLVPFNKELLEWHKDEELSEAERRDTYFLTLGEIAAQLRDKDYDKMVTIFVETPLEGSIYQMGNYRKYEWVKAGTLNGYA